MTSSLWPFFTFYGGKWRIAPRYPEPRHRMIIEPFAGSAGYSVRYADRAVTLCEADPIISGLWRYLIRVRAAEIRALPLIRNDQAGRRYRMKVQNYAALASWCRCRSGQVIVCENEGADWLPFEPFLAAKASEGKRRSGVSREAIWLNERA